MHYGKYTHLFALPATQAEIFEPLERMRAIVGNLRACASAAFPPNHFLRAVQCYSLPSKLVQPDAHRDDTRSTKESFRRIFETCGFAAVSQQMLAELTRMAPAADAAFARGLTVRQSWATAARDYPELKFGRQAVNLLLLARHSTADVERFLKVVAKQNSAIEI